MPNTIQIIAIRYIRNSGVKFDIFHVDNAYDCYTIIPYVDKVLNFII